MSIVSRDAESAQGNLVAVIDVGKTNIKLALARPDGTIIEQAQTQNHVVRDDGAPWRRHDLARAEEWMLDELRAAAARFPIGFLVAAGHGSAGVLVSRDDLERSEPRLPMIDYEQPVPPIVAQAYEEQAGDFEDRGSAIMHGTTHQARQMLWVEKESPDQFDRATAFLGVPQYWAWRLCGQAHSEVTYLAAQSDLWNVRQRRPSRLVEKRNWQRLLPGMVRAGDIVGTVRKEIAARTGLPASCKVLAGIHDSSANFFRYQSAGMSRFTMVSTGTWIVALSDHAMLGRLDPARGMTLNADIAGEPLGGCLTMGGREFSAIAGDASGATASDEECLARLIAGDTRALPSFGDGDGLFPGSANRGRIVGPQPQNAVERVSLAVLTTALLTSECLEALGNQGAIVLDGTFVKDASFAPLVAALHPQAKVLANRQADGVASGAALLAARHAGNPKAAVSLEEIEPLDLPGLAAYAERWRGEARSAAPA